MEYIEAYFKLLACLIDTIEILEKEPLVKLARQIKEQIAEAENMIISQSDDDI